MGAPQSCPPGDLVSRPLVFTVIASAPDAGPRDTSQQTGWRAHESGVGRRIFAMGDGRVNNIRAQSRETQPVQCAPLPQTGSRITVARRANRATGLEPRTDTLLCRRAVGGEAACVELGKFPIRIVRIETSTVDRETLGAAVQVGCGALAFDAAATAVVADAMDLAALSAATTVAGIGGRIDAPAAAARLPAPAPLLALFPFLVPGRLGLKRREPATRSSADGESGQKPTDAPAGTGGAKAADQGIEAMGVHEATIAGSIESTESTASESCVADRYCGGLAASLRRFRQTDRLEEACKARPKRLPGQPLVKLDGLSLAHRCNVVGHNSQLARVIRCLFQLFLV